jgi:putative FmdB family regulatory protein
MPLFEFRCTDCRTEFEELTSVGTAAVACPRCGSAEVNRLLSTFAVGTAGGAAATEPGPCGACGAPRRGMCGEA